MKEIFSDPDFTRVGYYESVLKEAGIPCFIRNAFSHNLITGIPSHLFFPKLCVVDDEDFDAAIALLKLLQDRPFSAGAARPDWICAKCGESVPGGFDECWKCSAPRPGGQAD